MRLTCGKWLYRDCCSLDHLCLRVHSQPQVDLYRYISYPSVVNVVTRSTCYYTVFMLCYRLKRPTYTTRIQNTPKKRTQAHTRKSSTPDRFEEYTVCVEYLSRATKQNRIDWTDFDGWNQCVSTCTTKVFCVCVVCLAECAVRKRLTNIYTFTSITIDTHNANTQRKSAYFAFWC